MSIPGGWSSYTSNMSGEAKAAFEEALLELVGVKYTPVACAQQVVAGMNYSFFCNAVGVYLESFPEAAVLDIHKPLDGKAELKDIRIIPPH